MSNFKTVLIEESIISQLSPEEVFGVYSGSSEKTLQRFQATSSSNNSLIWNVQIPSESIVMSRSPQMQVDLAFTIAIGSAAFPVPAGQLALNLGVTDALQVFPLQSLFTNYSVMINNTSITTNLQDILPQICTMYDKRELSRHNSTTPSMPDGTQGQFADTVGTNNNPLANVNDLGYDVDFCPRGAFPVAIYPCRMVNGAYVDNSLISTGAAGETWNVFVYTTVAEPFIALAPFCDIGSDNQSGLLGINTVTLTCNIDTTCKRLWSTANTFMNGTTLSSYITSIQLGTAAASLNIGIGAPSTSSQGFTNPFLLMEFLSLQASQASRISGKIAIGISDYPRYISSSTNLNPMLTLARTDLISQNIQLNCIPDCFIIAIRQQMSTQTAANTSGFLTINSISINFNNKSGVLASANQQQLYQLSRKNGSCQLWEEFSGRFTSSTVTGTGVSIPSIGSLLVLNPALDFGLDDFLSSGSLGQYNFSISLNVTNQYGYTVQPEVVVMCSNPGLFITEAGVSQTYQGILTKQDVLAAKTQQPVVDSHEYQRLVGGKLSNMGMGKILKRFHHRASEKCSGGGAMVGGGEMVGGRHHRKLGKYLK